MKAIGWELAASAVMLSPFLIGLSVEPIIKYRRRRRQVRALERWLETLEADRRRRNG